MKQAVHNHVVRRTMGSDVVSLQVAADCTGPSRDLDWHRAIVARSALPSVLSVDLLQRFACKPIEGVGDYAGANTARNLQPELYKVRNDDDQCQGRGFLG